MRNKGTQKCLGLKMCIVELSEAYLRFRKHPRWGALQHKALRFRSSWESCSIYSHRYTICLGDGMFFQDC